jgi:hypothetical protein
MHRIGSWQATSVLVKDVLLIRLDIVPFLAALAQLPDVLVQLPTALVVHQQVVA